MHKIVITVVWIYFFMFNIHLYSYNNSSRSVKIYNNGVSVVNEEYNVKSSNEHISINVAIPDGAVLETFNAFNLENMLISFDLEKSNKLLHKNDSITIFLENGSYFKGFIVNENGWNPNDGPILLNVESFSDINKYDNNPVLIDNKKIKAVMINKFAGGEDFIFRQQKLQKVNISGKSKSKDIITSYVTRNTFCWSPAYSLNLNNNEMNAYAIISSNYTLENTKISLILGSPYLEVVSYKKNISTMSMISEISVKRLESPSAGIFGEQWQYDFKNIIDLKENQTNKIPLFSAKLNLKDYYYWENGITLHRYKFTNKLDRPLPAGNIDFYRDNIWIGEDILNWTSIGEEEKITAEYAYDVNIEEKTVSQKEEETKRTITKSIEINNYKNKQIVLEIVSYLPARSNLIKANISPKVEGSKLTWNISSQANSKSVIKYTYEQLKEVK